MKIGFFCSEYPPRAHGGIGTFVRQMAEALVEEGHEVIVAEFGQYPAERQQRGVRVVTLRESRTRHVAWLLNRLRLRRWLLREVSAGRIEVFEIPEYQGFLPFPFMSCPVVVRLHHAESHISHLMNSTAVCWRIYWLEKATLFWHRRWIGVSRYILEETRRYFALEPRQAQVIYNPAPTIAPEALPSLFDRPKHYCLYVGSVSERKGALLLARAMCKVVAVYQDIHLVYVGPETEHDDRPISHIVREIFGDARATRLRFTGRRTHEETLAWMRSAALVVLPSRAESFGLVPVEAMHLGVPVIYTAVGPGPELIEHGLDGLLVDPCSEEELRAAIESLLSDPAKAVRMAAAGKSKVEAHFSVDTCIRKTIQFFEAALQNRNGS